MKVKYLQFCSKRTYGVEIEVNRDLTQNALRDVVNVALGDNVATTSGWGYTCNNDYWVVKPDSSCGDLGNKNADAGGYEVVSDVGRGVSHLLDITKVTAELKKAKAKTNNYCGFHCQVEIKDFKTADAATLLAYWCKVESFVGEMLPSRRLTSPHCRAFTDSRTKWTKAKKITTAADFWKLMKLSAFGANAKRNTITLVNYQRSKSTAPQWNYFHRPTVELRYPESSIESFEVKNWTRLFVNFVDRCYGRTFPENLQPASFREALIILGLKDPDYFTILSPGLFETKCWLLYRLNKYTTKAMTQQLLREEWRSMHAPDLKWKFDFPQVLLPELPKKRKDDSPNRPKPQKRAKKRQVRVHFPDYTLSYPIIESDYQMMRHR